MSPCLISNILTLRSGKKYAGNYRHMSRETDRINDACKHRSSDVIRNGGTLTQFSPISSFSTAICYFFSANESKMLS